MPDISQIPDFSDTPHFSSRNLDFLTSTRDLFELAMQDSLNSYTPLNHTDVFSTLSIFMTVAEAGCLSPAESDLLTKSFTEIKDHLRDGTLHFDRLYLELSKLKDNLCEHNTQAKLTSLTLEFEKKFSHESPKIKLILQEILSKINPDLPSANAGGMAREMSLLLNTSANIEQLLSDVLRRWL